MATRQLLAVASEAAYGDATAPVAADAVWAENVAWAVQGQRITADPARPTLGGVPGQVTGEHCQLSFDVQLANGGVRGTPPAWGPLLKMCGFAETVVAATSVTYALIPDPVNGPSGSFAWRERGRSHTAKGARGRVGVRLQAGQQPHLNFAFRGLYAPVAAGAPLVAADADFTDWREAPVVSFANTTFDFGGVALKLRELSVDAADNVRFTDLPNQQDVQLLGDRAFTGRLSATTPAVGVLSLEAIWRAQERRQFSLVHGAGAGKIVTVQGRGQLTDPPAYSDDGGQDVVSAGFQLLGSTLNASDDLVIICT